ncbi:MAG TPA: hypothetical protein VHD58_05690 [Mycobacteriales bacterium]|nr:hypothetical protein [Mycobacteriales bacterium]
MNPGLEEPLAARSARLLDDLARHRYAVLALLTVVLWVGTGAAVGWQGRDWSYFLTGAHALTGRVGLHVYARMPDLQFGPPALLVAVVFRDAGPGHGWALVSAICMLLGVVTIRLLERTAVELVGRAHRVETLVLLGGPFFLMTWTLPAVSQGHPDDVLALLAIAGAMRAVVSQRWLLAAALVGCAAAAKPWALMVLPLALAVRGTRVRALLVTIAVALVSWVPYFLGDAETRRVGDFHLRVEQTSTLHYLGFGVGAAPAWPREAQLVVALLLGAVSVLRGRWLLVPFVAFAVRINVDPSVVYYYAAGPVLGAFAWDLVVPVRGLPVRTIGAWLGLLAFPTAVLGGGTGDPVSHALIAAVRVAVLAAAVWGVAAPVRPGPGTLRSAP